MTDETKENGKYRDIDMNSTQRTSLVDICLRPHEYYSLAHTHLIHFAGFAQRLELNVGRDEPKQTLELVDGVQLLARGKPANAMQRKNIINTEKRGRNTKKKSDIKSDMKRRIVAGNQVFASRWWIFQVKKSKRAMTNGRKQAYDTRHTNTQREQKRGQTGKTKTNIQS